MDISLNESTSSKIPVKRKSIDKEKLCFACQEKRKSDNFPLNQGGLGRCTEERAGNRIEERTSIFLKDEDSRFHNAAIKLHILLEGSHDVYAAEVYHHESCYLKYAVNKIKYNKIAGNAESNEYEETLCLNILDDFLSKVERCIIFQRSAFLLSNFLKELMKLYKNYGICPLIDNTKELKRRLIKKFDEQNGFFLPGKQLIVFSIEVNPCQYSVATLDGFGSSDNDIIRSFARMVRRKLQTGNQLRESWPMSIDNIENFVQRGPLLELYSAIYATINPSFQVHSTGMQ